MKKFLLKAIVFLILLYVGALLLQSLIDRGLRRDNSGIYKEWNEIFQSKVNADILIQGSSRAYRHISPRMLDSVFKMDSYNLGLSGYGFLMQYYRFLFYMKYNRAPKYIIQNIDPYSLVKRKDLLGYLQFLPYLNDSIIRKAVSSYFGLDWRDMYVPLYKYHGNYQTAFRGLLDNIRKPSNNNGKYKGFQPQNLHWDTTFRSFKSHFPHGYRDTVDKETVEVFAKFLAFCKEKGITVIFVYTPEYYGAQEMLLNRDSIMNIFRNYSALYHIPFFDYSKHSICFDTNNFYNSQHLNTGGVKKFDMKLVNDLKSVIK